MTHTLGPWHVGMKPGPMIYGPHGEQIADMRHPAMVDDDEHAANARLIAAAPELLAALLDCVELVESEWTGFNNRDLSGGIAPRARAAIAKAKGQA